MEPHKVGENNTGSGETRPFKERKIHIYINRKKSLTKTLYTDSVTKKLFFLVLIVAVFFVILGQKLKKWVLF